METAIKSKVCAAGIHELCLKGLDSEDQDCECNCSTHQWNLEQSRRDAERERRYPCHCGEVSYPRGNGVSDICDRCFALWSDAGEPIVCPCTERLK